MGAPEVAQRKVYDEKCDIWSVGCTVHEMLTKKTPSELDNVPLNIIDIFLWARNVDETIRIDTQISDHVKQFLGSCLEINTEKRPSCQKLLKHEWFEEQESFQKWKVLQSGLPEWSDCKQKLDDLIEEETERSSCCVTVTKNKKSAVICFTLLLLATAAVAICVITKPWERPKEQSTEKKNLMKFEPDEEPHDDPIQKDNEQPENLNKDGKEEEDSKDNPNAKEPSTTLKIVKKSTDVSTWKRLINGALALFSTWKRLINGAFAFCKKHWMYAIIIITIVAALFMYFVGLNAIKSVAKPEQEQIKLPQEWLLTPCMKIKDAAGYAKCVNDSVLFVNRANRKFIDAGSVL